MGKLIIGLLVGFAIGVGGAFLLGSKLAGGAMGAGVATGLSAGICSVVEAARESGLLTPDQIGQILTITAKNMQSISGERLPRAPASTRTVEECKALMSDLRSAQSQ